MVFPHGPVTGGLRYFVIRSTAGLLTERQRRLAPPWFLSWRSRRLPPHQVGELPADADRLHHLEEAGAAAFAMLGQASLQVLAGAQIMLGVLVGAIKVEPMCCSTWLHYVTRKVM